MRMAALVHDIGKIAVPAADPRQAARLTESSSSWSRGTPSAAFDMLASIDFGVPVADIVLQHHERLDGSGYPQGLSQAQILLAARVLAVADVVEAMISHRPYRAALSVAPPQRSWPTAPGRVRRRGLRPVPHALRRRGPGTDGVRRRRLGPTLSAPPIGRPSRELVEELPEVLESR